MYVYARVLYYFNVICCLFFLFFYKYSFCILQMHISKYKKNCQIDKGSILMELLHSKNENVDSNEINHELILCRVELT